MSTELSLAQMPATKWEDKYDLVLRWARDERSDDDPLRTRIPAALEQQFRRWNQIYGLLQAGTYSKTTEQIAVVKKTFPGISDRTARNLLADTKRFFSVLDAPNLAWERLTLIEEVREDIKLARQKGDFRSVAALRTLYAKLTGADQPEEVVENKTIFNIIAFNPEQLGVELIDPDKLDTMIRSITASDKKKRDDFFTQFEDVTEAK
ncbi:hypothetical protein G8759_31305 [Spirosoma aureum]|uniref:Uncharacterized protein n=1 Tax=Spirosoma aureum TaxID=2692134 RepID=A0A6G9AWG2_9BACT|nr:hypothetical protein [Spirosoma aureum]QIP16812.1 hypothetical protein G8759_31305 [Spirosoma aureum]